MGRAHSQQLPPDQVALGGAQLRAWKLAAADPPRPPDFGKFWITSCRLGSGGGAFFYSAMALRFVLQF